MFITNPKGIKSTVLMDRKVGEYVARQGIPLLGLYEGQCVFKDTYALREEIKQLPVTLRLRLIMKGGVKV
jgi:UDP-glucose 6-dehydrogenase